MRCSTLARELIARGAEVHFLCRELPGDYCSWLEEYGFGVTRLHDYTDDFNDIAQCQAALAQIARPDWLVVDHYGLDVRWETSLRGLVKKILVIDDKADRAHDCDLLLDQNLNDKQNERYASLLPDSTQCLLGPRYAMLRPEFASARLRQRVRDGNVHRVLICFGGSDPHRHTIATLEALRSHVPLLERIDVIVGLANQDQTAIATICAELPNTVLHCQTDAVVALLTAADLAIGAGGTMNWERACLGVPTLAFGVADNQQQGLVSLIKSGYIVGTSSMPSPDKEKIKAWLTCLLDNPPLLRGLSARSATLVDGYGVKRIADMLLPTIFTFRPATLRDSKNLQNWRNTPEIRSISTSTDEIDLKTHETWLKNTLSDPLRILLVAEYEGQPAGIIRFDLLPQEAVISVYRIPLANAPRGLIRQATDWLHVHHPEIRRIRAEVLAHNSASLAAFRATGYRDVRNTLVIEQDNP